MPALLVMIVRTEDSLPVSFNVIALLNITDQDIASVAVQNL